MEGLGNLWEWVGLDRICMRAWWIAMAVYKEVAIMV